MWRIAVLSACLLCAACDDKPKPVVYGCDCTFLTDTDDTSTQKVEICETTAARAQSAAIGCAQSGAPATVQGCRCALLQNQRSCRAGDCAVREHR